MLVYNAPYLYTHLLPPAYLPTSLRIASFCAMFPNTNGAARCTTKFVDVHINTMGRTPQLRIRSAFSWLGRQGGMNRMSAMSAMSGMSEMREMRGMSTMNV